MTQIRNQNNNPDTQNNRGEDDEKDEQSSVLLFAVLFGALMGVSASLVLAVLRYRKVKSGLTKHSIYNVNDSETEFQNIEKIRKTKEVAVCSSPIDEDAMEPFQRSWIYSEEETSQLDLDVDLDEPCNGTAFDPPSDFVC